MRKHELTNKKTKTKTMINTFREHLQSFDLWDIWLEWWENMTWPTKKTTTKTNTFKEHLQRAIFEIFGLWDIWSERWKNMTWPTTKTKTNTMTMTNRFREQPQWGIFLDILRTPSDGHPREVLSLNSVRPFQTKFQNFGQISQPWNTWNTWS